MHVKVIKGKKYYYESVRIGKKVTSRYIGPVEKIDALKKQNQQLDAQPEESLEEGDKELQEDENYIG